MRIFHYTFTYLGHEVTYRLMARNKRIANHLARQRERTWRLAVDQYLEEHSTWTSH